MRFFTKLIIFFITSLSLAHADCKNKIVVAVVDTGIDAEHDLIKGHLWQNPSHREKFYGWDFATNSPNPTDHHGHGTHIAGIINQVSNCALIMPLRYYSPTATGTVNLKRSIDAINFAVDHGAQVINYSGGGPESSEEERMAFARAEQKGIIMVLAAGNEHHNIDNNPDYRYYPASYSFNTSIVVANAIPGKSANRDHLAVSSNWGKYSVDVATYGSDILSSIPNNRYEKMTGTSQSTAFVTGFVVELLSKNPRLSMQSIKYQLQKHTRRSLSLFGQVRTGGILEIQKNGRSPATN
jgi:subtilisin family serine protease